MFGIGGFELLIILVFAFLIFGPEKLPDMARTAGRAIAKFRNAQAEMNEVLNTTDFYDPNSDEPFKDPIEALDKLAKHQEEKKAAKESQKSSASAADDAAKPAEAAAAAAAPAAAEAADTPKQESFTERKARYERERAARKAAEEEAAKAAAEESAFEPAAEAVPEPEPAPEPAAAEPAPESASTEGGE